MTAPEFMPILDTGGHEKPQDGACIMEYVSLLAGEDEFTDRPECVHHTLNTMAVHANDHTQSDERQKLLTMITRFMGTSVITSNEVSLKMGTWLIDEMNRRIDECYESGELCDASTYAIGWCAEANDHLAKAYGMNLDSPYYDVIIQEKIDRCMGYAMDVIAAHSTSKTYLVDLVDRALDYFYDISGLEEDTAPQCWPTSLILNRESSNV